MKYILLGILTPLIWLICAYIILIGYISIGATGYMLYSLGYIYVVDFTPRTKLGLVLFSSVLLSMVLTRGGHYGTAALQCAISASYIYYNYLIKSK